MEHLPLISVIIPCYNQAKFVSVAISSILQQSYQNLEIIIIDDCSTDNSYALLEQYAAGNNRIRLYKNSSNLKLIQTLNKGVGLARGQYIARMDADDICSIDRLMILSRFLRDNPAVDIVSSYSMYLTEDGKHVSINPNVFATQHSSIHFISLFESPILHASLLGKREIFERFKYEINESNMHIEDYDLWSRMLKNGIIFATVPQYLYFYRINSGSVSIKFRQQQMTNHITRSYHNIVDCTGFRLDVDLLKVVLCRHEEREKYNYRNYIASIRLLDNVFTRFNEKYSYISCRESRIWMEQRKIKLWTFILVKGNFMSKLRVLLAFPAIIGPLISKFGWLNIKYRLFYLRNKICRNR